MQEQPIIDVIIPAFNEERSIGLVVSEIPSIVRHTVVVNNASTDQTAAQAKKAGAIVVTELQQGYGKACLTGIDYVCLLQEPPDIIVFIDGDYSDYPEELTQLVQPILDKKVDFVIGSRALGKREKGSMMPQQVFGNWLATNLIKVIYGVSYSDLGPFRAIRRTTLTALAMKDETYGWTVEMQIKVAKQGIPFVEIPVRYKKRIGQSKIAGTIKGTFGAGKKIIETIFMYSFQNNS